MRVAAALFVGALVGPGLSACGKYAPLERPAPLYGSDSGRARTEPAAGEVKTVDPRDLDSRTQTPPT